MTSSKRNFFRTIAGKTVLYILFTICAAVLVLSGAVGAFAWEGELYTKPLGDYLESQAEYNIHFAAYAEANNLILSNTDTGIIAMSINEDGEVIAKTSDYEDVSGRSGKPGVYSSYRHYEYPVWIVRDGEEIIDVLMYGPNGEAGSPAVLSVYTDPSEHYDYNVQIWRTIDNLKYAVYPIIAVSLISCIIIFIALMCVAGRRPGTEEVKAGPLGVIPFDVLAAAFLAISAGGLMAAGGAGGITEIAALCIWALFFVEAGIGLCMSLAARVKCRRLLKGTLIYKILRLIARILKTLARGVLVIPLLWRTVLVIGGLSFVEMFAILLCLNSNYSIAGFWFFEKVVLVPVALYVAWMLRRLLISGQKLASGDLSYRTELKGLWGDFRKHGENLNSISDAMSLAVDERLKSERMKTELITNVSHDIKTPLTSIINYASLIGEAIDEKELKDQKLSEYSEVIVRQSEKLKRLIEDLVEASRASSGNLDVEAAPLDACMFIPQTEGEYKDKLQASSLVLVTSAPDKKLMINADARRMMRVYDNLMNNICKYSQRGTRVYLSVYEEGGAAVTVFKNTSSTELNITADELVERFVRGDKSRGTEGNGLGLSIAKSLTELQGGTFDILIDGDLFKVTLRFPLM